MGSKVKTFILVNFLSVEFITYDFMPIIKQRIAWGLIKNVNVSTTAFSHNSFV